MEYQSSDIFVLPSFYEGLPMTVIEALACGAKVVVTDLPGIKPWIQKNVKNAPVIYVTPPEMKNIDEAVAESLPTFEKNLAEAIIESSQLVVDEDLDLSKVSWTNICNTVLLSV